MMPNYIYFSGGDLVSRSPKMQRPAATFRLQQTNGKTISRLASHALSNTVRASLWEQEVGSSDLPVPSGVCMGFTELR